MKKRKNYFSIDNDYVKFYAKYLGVVATAVYTSLYMHSDYNTKRCWPSMETIAKQHGLGRHSVSKALHKLEEWKIISIEKAIDRKNKKRKNNVYTLLSKESWKKLPEEEDDHGAVGSIDSHGIESTIPMVSKMPQDGTENTSNKTHIIKTIREQNTNCGQKPTVCVGFNQTEEPKDSRRDPLEEEPKTTAWDSNKEIINLANSDYPDYKIIGFYFNRKRWFFENKKIFETAFKRALTPANLLKSYKLNDVVKAMECCEESYSGRTGWTLETVLKRIDDYLTNGFFASDIY